MPVSCSCLRRSTSHGSAAHHPAVKLHPCMCATSANQRHTAPLVRPCHGCAVLLCHAVLCRPMLCRAAVPHLCSAMLCRVARRSRVFYNTNHYSFQRMCGQIAVWRGLLTASCSSRRCAPSRHSARCVSQCGSLIGQTSAFQLPPTPNQRTPEVWSCNRQVELESGDILILQHKPSRPIPPSYMPYAMLHPPKLHAMLHRTTPLSCATLCAAAQIENTRWPSVKDYLAHHQSRKHMCICTFVRASSCACTCVCVGRCAPSRVRLFRPTQHKTLTRHYSLPILPCPSVEVSPSARWCNASLPALRIDLHHCTLLCGHAQISER